MFGLRGVALRLVRCGHRSLGGRRHLLMLWRRRGLYFSSVKCKLERGDGGELTSQRRNPIHEDPETGKSERRLENTVECKGEREHESSDVTSGLGIREGGDKHMCESACKDEELDEQQENETLARRWRNSAASEDRVEI